VRGRGRNSFNLQERFPKSALDARSPDIMRLILGEGTRLVTAGIATGMCGAILLT
jgi:hypothetical protein